MKRKMRKLLSLLISLSVMASGFSFTAFAADVPEVPESSSVEIREESPEPDDASSDVVVDGQEQPEETDPSDGDLSSDAAIDGQEQPEETDPSDGDLPSDAAIDGQEQPEETDPSDGDLSSDAVIDGQEQQEESDPEETELPDGTSSPDNENLSESDSLDPPPVEDSEGTDENEETSKEGEENSASSALEAFQAAVDAIGEAEDLETVKAALDACFAAYENLAEEEKAEVADAYAALLAYQEELANGEESIDTEDPQESEENSETNEETPNALDVFQAAVDAIGETEDLEAVKAALDACFAAYENLTEEEKAMVAETYAALLAYQEELENGELGIDTMTNAVATVNGVGYETLQEAVAAAQDGDTVILLKDVEESVTVSKDVTFDLGGNNWTGTTNTALTINGVRNANVAVTVMNGTIIAGDNVSSSAKATAIYAQNADLTLENCDISGNGTGTLVRAEPTSATTQPNVHVTINGGSFSNAAYGVYLAVEGNVKDRSMTANISDAVFCNNTHGLKASVNNSIPKPPVDVTITSCIFEDNTSSGINIANNKNNVDNFKVNVVDSKFLNNTGSALKMASSSDYATVSITGGEISGNIVSYSSDSVIKVNGPFTMKDTMVSDNEGYHIFDLQYPTSVTIEDAVISNNTSRSKDGLSMGGGGPVLIKAATGPIKVTGTKFTGNTAGNYGGALSVYNTGTVVDLLIDGCEFTKNTSNGIGGAIYADNKGGITINDTLITENTANSSVSKTMGYGQIGGGLYVANITGTVTLSGSTRVYNNHTPGDKQVPGTNDGGSADIVLASTAVTSSSTAKNPDNFTHAELVLDCKTSFTGEDGNTYTLTEFDRKSVNANGYYYTSGKNYYWPMGYYTAVEEPTLIFLGGEHTGPKDVVATDLADAVKQAKDGTKTVYVCSKVELNMANQKLLNESGVTFVRCQEHPNGYMFTVNGTVTLDGAHIDGRNLESDSALISVPASSHLIIDGDTIIENGKNVKGNGGGIYLNQGGLTMTGGTITGNYTAKQGGGIYAYSNNNGSKLVFEGGTVSRNTAKDSGGGAMIGYVPSEFGLQGGRTIFDGNTAYMGGGVYFNHNEHKIYRGNFTNNTATRPSGSYYDGGGIYIEHNTTVEMRNVFISGNKTNSKKSMPASALGICPTGNLAILDCSGLLSVNNGGDDINMSSATIPLGPNYVPGNPNAVLKVSRYAVGGGQISYLKKNLLGFDAGTKLSEEAYENGFTGSLALNTVASEQTIQWAREAAEKDGVVVTGNYAEQCGSGIMTNGNLIIGTETKSISVEKVWEDGNENHTNDQILVYLTRNGKVVDATKQPTVNGKKLSELTEEEIKKLITQNGETLNLEYLYPETRDDATVILNASNNWSYTWINLDPAQEWGIVEASVPGYTPSLIKEQDTDKLLIYKLTNTPNNERTTSLIVEKMAIGMDPDASYPFYLKLDNVGDKVFSIQLDGTIYPIYNNEITFYLKSGQSAVVEGLPEGFTYELKELVNYEPIVFESDTADEPVSIHHVLVVNMPSINIPVEKIWTDDLESLRPASVTVQLLDGDYVVDDLTLTAENGWKGVFTGVPQFNAEGKEIQYSVKELNVPDNYEDSYSGDNDRLVITNAYQGGKLTLTKALNDGAPDEAKEKEYTFKVTGPNSYYKEVTLKAGESKTLENLKPGTYMVTEVMDNTNIEHYTLTVEGQGDVVVKPAEEHSVTITNNYEPLPGGLTIKKIVTGDSAEALVKEYRFRVVGPKYDEIVTVKGNNTFTLTGLTPGKYTITELDAEIEGYKHTVTVDKEGGIVDVLLDTEENGIEITFTNDYQGGSLVLQKTVNADAPAAAFHNYAFRVVGPDNYDQEFSVPANGAVTLTGLKAGQYMVTEIRDGTAIDQYTLDVTGEGTAQVLPDHITTVTITNNYQPLPGGLTIRKVVSGISSEAYEKTYYFNVSGPNGYSNRVSITGSGSVTISDLAPGTYTVTEEDATINGYVLNVTGEGTVEVPINGGVEIIIRNDYEPPYRPDRPEEPEEPGEELPEEPTPLTPPDEEIPEDPTPLAPPKEEEEEEIPEEDIPLVDAPKTGSSHHGLMAALAALLGLGAVAAAKKRKDDNV